MLRQVGGASSVGLNPKVGEATAQSPVIEKRDDRNQLFLSEGLASAFLLSSFCFGGQVMLGGKRFRGALDLFWSFSSQLVDEFDNVGMPIPIPGKSISRRGGSSSKSPLSLPP